MREPAGSVEEGDGLGGVPSSANRCWMFTMPCWTARDDGSGMSDTRGLPSSMDTGRSDGEDGLATLLSGFAREVQQENDPAGTLAAIVQNAVALIPGCDEGSISVALGRKKVQSEASSGGTPPASSTPCRSRRDGGRARTLPTSTSPCACPTWPTSSDGPSSPQARSTPELRGCCHCSCSWTGDALGALNLFSRQPGAFDDESEHIGLLFAAHATLAYAAVQQQARSAHRVVIWQLIGQAQGLLMERHKITPDQAFALLVKAAQHANVRLRDVADELVYSGRVPEGRWSSG